MINPHSILQYIYQEHYNFIGKTEKLEIILASVCLIDENGDRFIKYVIR
jgi:hypothetical protein